MLNKYKVTIMMTLVDSFGKESKKRPIEEDRTVYAVDEEEAKNKALTWMNDFNSSRGIGKYYQFKLIDITVEKQEIEGNLYLVKLSETVVKKAEIEMYIEAEDTEHAVVKVDENYSDGKYNNTIEDNMSIVSISNNIEVIGKDE